MAGKKKMPGLSKCLGVTLDQITRKYHLRCRKCDRNIRTDKAHRPKGTLSGFCDAECFKDYNGLREKVDPCKFVHISKTPTLTFLFHILFS